MATEAPATCYQHLEVEHVQDKDVSEEKKATEDNAAQQTKADTNNEEMTKIDASPNTEALQKETEEKEESKNVTVVEVFENEEEALKSDIHTTEKVENPKQELTVPTATEPVVEVREEELKQLPAVSDVSDKSSVVEEPIESSVAQEESNEVIVASITEGTNHGAKFLEQPIISESAPSKEETLQTSEGHEKQSGDKNETSNDLKAPNVQNEFNDIKEQIPKEEEAEYKLEEPTIVEHTSISSGSNLEEEIYAVQENVVSECLEAGIIESLQGNKKQQDQVILPVDLGSDEATYEDAITVTKTYKEQTEENLSAVQVNEKEASETTNAVLATEREVAGSIVVEPEAQPGKHTEVHEQQVNEATKEDVEVKGDKGAETLEGEKIIPDKASEDVNVPTEVTKLPSQGEKTSGNTTITAREKDDTFLGGNPALVETLRDVEVDGGAISTETISKKVEVEEQKTTGAKESETTEEIDKPRTCKEASKEEVPPKSLDRHSNKLLSKLKQSLAKVKKAIVRKSSNSKTISAETKECIQVILTDESK